MIRIYRVNSGSCGGCDLEIEEAVRRSADLAWVQEPLSADLIVLTGPITVGARPLLQALLRELAGRVPLVAVGRCALDGSPFGRGGLAANPEIVARLTLDGCPPTPTAIAAALRDAARPVTEKAQ